jgi:hypothetical protein
LKNPRNDIYVILTVRLCSPFNFVQGDPEFIEGSPSLSVVEGSEAKNLRISISYRDEILRSAFGEAQNDTFSTQPFGFTKKVRLIVVN